MSGVELFYDPCRYLVIAGEAEFEGSILEASRNRPYLAVSIEIPADVVAKTLLALAEADIETARRDGSGVHRQSRRANQERRHSASSADDDPIERRFVAPLVMEELVFRLLRCDAAAVLRSGVRRDRDADPCPGRCTSCARTPPRRCPSKTSRVTSP